MEAALARLAKLGLTLPPAVDTRFAYRPIIVDGGCAYVAGQLAKLPDDSVMHPGVVGREVDFEMARIVAQACALQALAWIAKEAGGLDRVRRVLRLNGYVNVGAFGFARMSEVIDGASTVLVGAFGEAGEHPRSVLGVADLPRHASVMIDMTVALR